MNQVRLLTQQLFPVAQAFADQCKLAILQVAQSTVDNPRRAAGCSRSKVVLLHQKRTFAAADALHGNGYPTDATADDDNIKVFSIQGRSCAAARKARFQSAFHHCMGCGRKKPAEGFARSICWGMTVSF